VSSCFSAGSAHTMWDFGRRRLRRMARRSSRMSSALMRCARPIALYSECWNGEGWKLNECESYYSELSQRKRRFGPFFGFGFFFFRFPSGLRVSLVQVSSGNRAFPEFWPRGVE
jgi:hypothetical protein